MEETRYEAAMDADGDLLIEMNGDGGMSERERRARELERSFSYDDYVVVRKELFAHLRDPAIIIRPDSISFNQACIDGLPETVYIRLSVNEQLKRILVEPCHEDTPHALRWCIAKGDKRKSRKMMGSPFANLLYSVMGWDKRTRYKVLGFRINLQGIPAYVFLLDTPEKFDITSPARKRKGKATQNDLGATAGGFGEPKASAAETDNMVSSQTHSSAKGYYSEEVLRSFGMSVDQYRRNTAIVNTDGYVQIGMLTGGGGLTE